MRRLPLMLGGFVLLAVCALLLALLPPGATASPGEKGGKGNGPKGDCPPSWQLVSSPAITDSIIVMGGLAVISSTDAWAIGSVFNQEYGLIEHWDGMRWSLVPPAPIMTGSVWMLGIDATGPDDVWIAGYHATDQYAQPLIEHWDGMQWSVAPVTGISSTTPSLLYGIDAVTSGEAWAVGYVRVSTPEGYRQRTLTLHWSGAEWHVVPSPNSGTHNNVLYAVSGTSATDVWAVGRYWAPEGTYLPLVMHWDGVSWTIVPTTTGITNVHHLRAVHAIAPNDVWLVGSYLIGGFFKTLVMHWDGAQWSVVPSPNPAQFNNNRLRDIYAVAAGDVWAVGHYNDGYRDVPLIEHWDGTQWTVVATPGPANQGRLEAVDGSPDGDLWAGGLEYDEYSVGHRTMLLMRYSTACPTSTATPTPTPSASPSPTACTPGLKPVQAPSVGTGNYLHAIHATSANDIWAVGEYEPERPGRRMPLIEHWDGTAWSIVPGNPVGLGSTKLWGISGTAANDMWAVGEYTDHVTGVTSALAKHWNGTSWADVPVPAPGTLSNILRDVIALTPDDVWAVGSFANQATIPLTLVMRWNGSQWRVVDSPNPGTHENALNAIAAGPAGNLWAVGYKQSSGSSERPLVLRWEGAAWQVVIEALENHPNGAQLNDVAVHEAGVWVVGWQGADINYSGRRFLAERWDGAGWSIAPSPSAHFSELYSVEVGPDQDAWAVGVMINNPTVLHWNGSEWGTAISSGMDGGGYELDDVLVLPSGEVWAAGRADIEPLIARNDRSCSCTTAFSDVPPGSTFHSYVTCLACRKIVAGYDCGGPSEPCDPLGNSYYRPNAQVTRGQLAKIVALTGSTTYIPPDRQSFEDVPSGSPFWQYVEHVRNYGYVAGYPCGGPGEPCVPPENRHYYRPGAHATRGQIAKIVASAALLTHNTWDTQQTFEDVPPGSTFWQWVEGLADAGVIGGYPCGGPGEPCGPENRPYFRPNNPTTRGQMAKFAAYAFFPYCSNLRP